MPLTDTAIRLAKPTGRDYTLKDGDGLALFVGASGAKNWHFRFSWAGKQPRISLGTYPEISLKEARELRDQARALVAKGVAPRIHRRQERKAALLAASNTFEAVFRSWRDFKALSLKDGRQSTLSQVDRIFKKDLLPALGPQSIFEITRADLLEVLRKIEGRGAHTTAEKCRTWFNQLFRYAMVEVELQSNPAADLDIVAMPKPRVKHNPFLRMEQLPAFLVKLRHYGGDLNTQLGLRLLLLTGVRTGEMRSAVPEQFDLERSLWIVPPENVKQLQEQMRKKNKDCTEIPPYLVPLPRQAVAIVRELLRAKSPAQPSATCCHTAASPGSASARTPSTPRSSAWATRTCSRATVSGRRSRPHSTSWATTRTGWRRSFPMPTPIRFGRATTTPSTWSSAGP